MKHNSRIIRVLAISLAFLSVQNAIAESSTARFLMFRPSAYSNSLGGAGVALYGEAFGTYFNPAGLAFTSTLNASGSFVRPIPVFDNIGHMYLAGSVNTDRLGAFGVAGNLYWKGLHATTGSAGPSVLSTEELMDWQIKVSYAHTITEGFSAGISLGILRLNVSESATEGAGGGKKGRSTSAVADIGFLFQAPVRSIVATDEGTSNDNSLSKLWANREHTGLSMGLSILNIGPSITYINAAQSDNMPTCVLLGFAYSPVRTVPLGVMLTFDCEKELYEPSMLTHVRWGVELRTLKLIAVRGGYVQDTFGPKTSYGTWGIGLHLRFLQFNVARYTRVLLPTWHYDATFSWEIE